MISNKRNKRYWEEVRAHLISHAQGRRGAAVLRLALADDWLFAVMNYAPAGEHIAPDECAAVIIRKLEHWQR